MKMAKIKSHQLLDMIMRTKQRNIRPEETNMGENKELTEMKAFISRVMKNLKDFEQRLTAQLNAESTHLER